MSRSLPLSRPSLVPGALLLALTVFGCAGGISDAPRRSRAPEQREAGRSAGEALPLTTSSAEARRLFLEARRKTSELRNAEAYQLYRRAAEADPGFAMAYLGMAETSPTNREGYAAMEQALERIEGVSPAERWLILGRRAGFNGDADTQLASFLKVVEAHPASTDVRILVAATYLQTGRPDQAIEQLEEVRRLDPELAGVYNLLGYAYSALERTDDAEQAFLRLIDLLPDEPNPLDSYAHLLRESGRYDEAIRTYRRALALDPDFFFSRLGVADSLLLAGRHDEAREAFQETYDRVATDGQRREALLGQAIAYLDEERVEEAMEVMSRRHELAKRTDDRVAEAGDFNLQGHILLETGNPDGAAESFRRSLETLEQAKVDAERKDVDRRAALYLAGRVAVARGDLDAARSWADRFEAAIGDGRAPTPGERSQAHELRGRIALAAGEPRAALAELEQADERAPWNLYLRALAHRESGDDDDARALARRALEPRHSNLPHIFYDLRARRLLEELGDSPP